MSDDKLTIGFEGGTLIIEGRLAIPMLYSANAETREAREQERLNQELAKELTATIDRLELPVRPHSCLLAEGLKHIGDLIAVSPTKLMGVPNLGRVSVSEIECALTQYFPTLMLGYPFPEWDEIRSKIPGYQYPGKPYCR